MAKARKGCTLVTRWLFRRNGKSDPGVKKMLLTILAVFSGGYLFGQSSYGLRAGFLGSQLYLSPTTEQEMHQGYFIGFSYTLINNDKAGILLDLNWENKGFHLQFSDSTYSREQENLSLNFFTRIALGKSHNKFLIDLGPQLAYVLSATETSEGGNEEFDRTYNFEEGWERWNFALCVGFGYQWFLQERWELELNARFVQALTQVYPIEEYLYSLPQDILLSAAIRYRITK
jgi:hypothetical protein